MTSSGIDIGELPDIPAAQSQPRIADRFDYPVAYNFAFVGVGQCGGRIAEGFSDLGYGRVCAVNSTIADLEVLKLPTAAKLDVGQARGAGKDPANAAAIIADKGEDVHDMFTRTWGDQVDYAFVCFSAAGGTGAGCFSKVADVARSYLAATGRPTKVGAIVALPKDAEGQRFATNTLYTIKKLANAGFSPVIFIDNERFVKLFSNVSSFQEKPQSNRSTSQILHAFNRVAGTNLNESGGTTFDRADFAKLLDSGVVSFATCALSKWDSPADITAAVREQLNRNVLASVDLSTGNVAGLVYLISGAAVSVPSTHLDAGAAMLTRMLQNNSTVFTGVYPGVGGDTIKILAMIGGLTWPRPRLVELAKIAGERRADLIEYLGV